MQKNSSLDFMSLVGFQASKIWIFFGKLTAKLVWESFSGGNNSLEPTIFDFLTVFHMVWKSCESCLVGFGVSDVQKSKKFRPTIFFVRLRAAIMELLINLKIVTRHNIVWKLVRSYCLCIVRLFC